METINSKNLIILTLKELAKNALNNGNMENHLKFLSMQKELEAKDGDKND